MIPCKDCLVLPICRNRASKHEGYWELLNRCSLINWHLYFRGYRIQENRRPDFYQSLDELGELFNKDYSEIMKRQDKAS